MPYFAGDLVELPLTTTQDYSLFHILGQYSIDLWKEELDFIASSNGLATFIVHPDYVIERRARDVYENLLQYLSELLQPDKTLAAVAAGRGALVAREKPDADRRFRRLLESGGPWFRAGACRLRADREWTAELRPATSSKFTKVVRLNGRAIARLTSVWAE